MNRYAGISPFTSELKKVFFGRDKDIDELYEQILLEKQVLLYAKSGIGKTSLLNAGVLPKLEQRNEFLPLSVRFRAYDDKKPVAPLQRIRDLLGAITQIDLQQPTILEQVAPTEKDSLWFLFKKIQLLKPDLSVILVFDQFEELFSYPEALINDFKKQFSEILKGDVPPRFVQLFAKARQENRERMGRELMNFLNRPLEIKSVYIIRSDKLSELNRLADRIPNIQKSHYELLPLSEEQARQAILKPASEPGAFDSPVFEYAEDTLAEIISFLSQQHQQSVETTQLQIICQKVEEIIVAKSKNSSSAQKPRVEKQDLPKFDAIFFNFYEDAVKKLPQAEQAKAIKLIEDNLIRNNQRISLDQNICTEYIPKAELDLLVSTHLLRAERNTVGGFSYELSHDTLVKPISEARKIRLDKEEEQRQAQENAENQRLEREKAEQERQEFMKERRRQRKIISVVSLAAVVSILFGIFGFVMKQKADTQAEIAREKAREVQKALDQFEQAEARNDSLKLKNLDSRINTIINAGLQPTELQKEKDSIVRKLKVFQQKKGRE